MAALNKPHLGLRLASGLDPQTITPKEAKGTRMAEETATLAAYVAGLRFEDIPEEVRARAKALTLD